MRTRRAAKTPRGASAFGPMKYPFRFARNDASTVPSSPLDSRTARRGASPFQPERLQVFTFGAVERNGMIRSGAAPFQETHRHARVERRGEEHLLKEIGVDRPRARACEGR